MCSCQSRIGPDNLALNSQHSWTHSTHELIALMNSQHSWTHSTHELTALMNFHSRYQNIVLTPQHLLEYRASYIKNSYQNYYGKIRNNETELCCIPFMLTQKWYYCYTKNHHNMLVIFLNVMKYVSSKMTSFMHSPHQKQLLFH